ncbi:MAG: acyltransferase [Saprospiraceae bacterium]|nr:acyltransferase [Saprospiraceae bacterium]
MVEQILMVLRFFLIKYLNPSKIISQGIHAVGIGSIFKIRGLLRLGRRTSFGRYNYVDIQGKLSIGDRCFINDQVRLVCHKEIIIGNNVLIAAGVSIYDHDHKTKMLDGQMVFDGYTTASIHIGDNVWIGEKVMILKGVSIGNNVIIGAGSVVNADIATNSVAVGNPCKVVKSLS